MHKGVLITVFCFLLLPWAAGQEDVVILENEDTTPVPTKADVENTGHAAAPAPTAETKKQTAPAQPAPPAPQPPPERNETAVTDEGELPDWLLEEEEGVIRQAQQAAGERTSDHQFDPETLNDEPEEPFDISKLPLEYRYPLAPRQKPRRSVAVEAEADEQVVSHSRLFTVSGGDALRMGAIASRADDLFRQVCGMLKLDTQWKNPISIRLVGKTTDLPKLNPIRTRIRIIGNTPNFQIRIYPGGGIDLTRLDNAIVAMVLYERALRDMAAEEYPDTINLPDWLVTGVQQAVMLRSGNTDRSLYKRLANRAEMLSPEEIVSTEKPWTLDAATRQIYDVSCGVLILALMDSPAGMDQLKSLLAEVATVEGTPKEIITRHFHELGVDSSLLNKWWALELAALALPRSTDALTPLESEKRLKEALTLIYYDPESETPRPLTIDNAYDLLAYPGWDKLVPGCVERLVELSVNCFPGYRPIVIEYSRVVADMMDGADADALQNRLGPLQELRRAYVAAATRGRDYLDWYEITHLGQENSRSFDAYLEAMQVLRHEDKGADTAMGRYLDDIEALYKQPADAPLPERLQQQLPEKPKTVSPES